MKSNIRAHAFNLNCFIALPYLFLIFQTEAASQTNQTFNEELLEEIIVVSSRVETPIQNVGTAVSVITAEDIQLHGYHSVSEILRTQPGIGVSNNGGIGKPTALRIRGEEGYRTLLMIDGVELADPSRPQGGPAFEHFLTTSDVERIEILRGPQGFIYGADAGGVVHILTRPGSGPLGGSLNVGYGGFGTTKLDGNIAGGTKKTNFFISASDFNSDGYNAKISDTKLMDKDGYDNKTLHTKFGWNPTSNLNMQLVSRKSETMNEFDGCGFPTTNKCLGVMNQETFKFSGKYKSERFEHLLGISNSDVDRSDAWAGSKSFSTEGHMRRLDYTGTFEMNEHLNLVYGIDLDKDKVLSNEGEILERTNKGIYFEYHGELANRLYITAGARNDDNDDFGKHTSIRVTSAYLKNLSAGSELKYRISYGTGFRAPSLYEIAYNTGPFSFPPASNFSITEESSSGIDLGVEYANDNGLVLEATYFDQIIKDELFFDLAGYSGYLQSTGNNSSKGLEFFAEYSMNSKWTLFGNLTLNDTKDQQGLQRIRRPKQLMNLGLKFSSMNKNLNMLINYRSSSDAIDELYGIGRIGLDDYEVLDFSAIFKINEGLEAYCHLENITNKSYQEVTGFRTPGFTAHMGIRLRF